MNLIEQQTAAKELPMQYLQQAVNGQNPNLTPWIATAELQRRTTMNQHMQNAQGPQGPQPTVKDQVEQKAGLMATQAAQQAQAAQAQQSSAPPGPVPGGIPQPEGQPEEPVMAAGGGLMQAPVNFQFAHGGILGYAEGSKDPVPDPEAAQLASDRKAVEEGLKKFGYAAADIAAMPFRAASALLNTLVVRPTRAVTGAAVPYFPMMGGGDNMSVTPYTDRAYQAKQAEAPAAEERPYPDRVTAGRQPAPAGIAPGQGILSALPKAPPVGGPQRAPAPPVQKPQPTVQQPPAMNPEEKIAADYTKSATPQASLQGAISNEQALAKAYNLDQPMGVEERDIIAQRNAARDSARKREAGDAFSAWVSGLVGVPGAAGMAYSQARQAQDAAEREHLGTNLKDIRELNTAQRAAQEKRSGTASADFAKQQEAAAAALKDKATVAAQLFNISSQAARDAAQNMTSLEVARISAASAARPGEAERLMATAIGLKATDPAKYAAFMETLSAVKGAGRADQGAAIADKAFDNVNNLMKGNIALQMKYTKDPAAFQQAVEAETARLRGGGGGSTGTMAPDRAAQFKVIR